MEKKTLVIGIIISLVLFSGAYTVYGYFQFKKALEPTGGIEHRFVVIKPPGTNYIVLPIEMYQNLIQDKNWSLPMNSKLYFITIDTGLTGDPESDLNMTFRFKYSRFTIIIGNPEVKSCSSSPKMFQGSCPDRTAAVTEITAMIASIFKDHYYQEALSMGMSIPEAKAYAYEQTTKRYGTSYLSFFTKSQIGLGKLGNREHLVVILIGPAEGAEENKIIIPRQGLVILKGKTDDTLRAEIALIERAIGFQWPQGSSPTG